MFRTGCGKGELVLLRGDGDSDNQGKEGLGSETDENARKRFKEDCSGFGMSNEPRWAGERKKSSISNSCIGRSLK